MDKNELNEHLQWVIGMAMTIESKIKSTQELSRTDYSELENAITGIKSELEAAKKIQYPT